MSQNRKRQEENNPLSTEIRPSTLRFWHLLLREYIPLFPDVLVQIILRYTVLHVELYDVLDVYDQLCDWHPAVIVKKQIQDGVESVLVHFWHYRQEEDETIQMDSNRFAPLGQHTGPFLACKCKHCWSASVTNVTLTRCWTIRVLGDRYDVPNLVAEDMWNTLCRDPTTCIPCSKLCPNVPAANERIP